MLIDTVTPTLSPSGLPSVREVGVKTDVTFLKKLSHGSRFWPNVKPLRLPVFRMLSTTVSTVCRELYITLITDWESGAGTIWNL